MSKRKSLTKKLRFEVFKRDGFKCCYCGRTPPVVILECDHVIPVKDGGSNAMENLVAACFDCNRGKSSVSLNSVPPTMAELMKAAREKEEQVQQFRKFMDKLEKRLEADSALIGKIFSAQFTGRELTDSFTRSSVYKFLKELPFHEVKEAMVIAVDRVPHNGNNCARYFCGVCWRKIRKQGGGNA